MRRARKPAGNKKADPRAGFFMLQRGGRCRVRTCDPCRVKDEVGDITGLRDGVRPESEALAAVDRHIESMAASVRINPFAFAQAGGGGEPVSAYPADSHRYACKFFPDMIRARLYAEVKSIYQGGPTGADDDAQGRLEERLLELERQEEAYIRQAGAEGKSIPRRADANPAVLLAD